MLLPLIFYKGAPEQQLDTEYKSDNQQESSHVDQQQAQGYYNEEREP